MRARAKAMNRPLVRVQIDRIHCGQSSFETVGVPPEWVALAIEDVMRRWRDGAVADDGATP